MGTSVSQHSPDTHNWRVVTASYLSKDISTERITQEIWRAATNQPSGDLASSLAEPIIAKCLKTFLQSSSALEAAHAVSKTVALSGEASLATDIAIRAVIASFSDTGNRRMNFIRSLFSEAVDYLVSRDLPGFVGRGERIINVSSSIDFKQSIKKQVEIIIDQNPVREKIETDPESWKNYIYSQIKLLSNK